MKARLMAGNCIALLAIGCAPAERAPQRCPEMDRTTWQQRIVEYVESSTLHDIKGRSSEVRLEGGEYYADQRVGAWNVPFRLGADRYVAVIDCDGTMQLYDASPHAPSPVF